MTAPPKTNTLFAPFSQSISIARLEAFRDLGDDNLETLAKCVWNICLCEALYPVLQNLEIGLRNTLHAAAEKSFGDPFWFRAVLHASEQAQVTQAEQELRRWGKPIEPGRIVAELNFGFWTSLFDSRYDRVLINRPGFLRDAFRPMPRRLQNRITLSRRFSSIRKLRNRVFHHERILNRALAQDHAAITEAIGWISPTLLNVSQTIDRFAEVIDPAFYAKLKTKLDK